PRRVYERHGEPPGAGGAACPPAAADARTRAPEPRRDRRVPPRARAADADAGLGPPELLRGLSRRAVPRRPGRVRRVARDQVPVVLRPREAPRRPRALDP